MSLILMTTLFYKAVILYGEIWRWSLSREHKANKGKNDTLIKDGDHQEPCSIGWHTPKIAGKADRTAKGR